MTIGSLKAQDFNKQIWDQYEAVKESGLTHRRFKQADLEPLIHNLLDKGFTVIEAGRSYQNRPIYQLSIGSGPTTILLWSQMHGDEATATMALFDVFNFLARGESEMVRALLEKLTIYFIPMLNPDGAELFQRRTSQGIDMNRDALSLQCPESELLKSIRDQLDADFGFNLHDQSIYYTVGTTEEPATISFLAPAYNEEKDVNQTRSAGMKLIAIMNRALQQFIPGQVGKYDDTFEPRAFGDNIQKWGTSTVLIESGGYHDDPEKQYIRRLNFLALLTAFNSIANQDYLKVETDEYWKIPMNRRNLNDLLIRDVQIGMGKQGYKVDIAIQREEHDHHGSPPMHFSGTIEDMGDLSTQSGFEVIDQAGLSYAPGKIYPDILKDQQAVKDLGVRKLLAQGYTTFQLEEIPPPDKVEVPFDMVADPPKPGQRPAVNQRATFLLYEEEELSYVIINGKICMEKVTQQ